MSFSGDFGLDSSFAGSGDLTATDLGGGSSMGTGIGILTGSTIMARRGLM